jgi:hypothetical protein
MNDPKQFDALVDIVARRMTAGEARPMRARVMLAMARREGLSRAKSRDRSPRPMFWAMGAVATTACAAVVFVNLRLSPTAPLAPQVAARPALGAGRSALANAEQSASSAAPRLLSERIERQPSAQRPAPAPGVPSPDQLAWQADAVPVLEPLALLTLENIQPEQLEVRPLTMAPLDVPLIGAEDE